MLESDADTRLYEERRQQIRDMRRDLPNYTLEDISKFYGVTRERVRQITADIPAPKRATTKKRYTRIEERFWEFVDWANEGCWNWHGFIGVNGYGHLRYHGKPMDAHRVAYILAHGPIPDGFFVCHTCDNPKCCRPEHLYAGTAADNVHDREAHGRGNHNHRLDIETIKHIKHDLLTMSCAEVARKYQTGYVNIHHIKSGKSYSKVEIWYPNEQLTIPAILDESGKVPAVRKVKAP